MREKVGPSRPSPGMVMSAVAVAKGRATEAGSRSRVQVREKVGPSRRTMVAVISAVGVIEAAAESSMGRAKAA